MKIKKIIEIEESDIQEIADYRNGEHRGQLRYEIVSNAFKAIANGTPITEGDLIMFRTLMTEIANKGLPFEEVLLLIDNAKTPTEGDLISRSALRKQFEDRTLEDFNCYHFIEAIDNAPTVEPERPKGEWIPVSERLPDKEGKCLVFTDYGDVTMDSYRCGLFVCNLGNVTHWKPLPKSPESEDK